MKIYAITTDYESPYAYYSNKATAEWDLANKIEFNSDYDYIIEIEVI